MLEFTTLIFGALEFTILIFVSTNLSFVSSSDNFCLVSKALLASDITIS